MARSHHDHHLCDHIFLLSIHVHCTLDAIMQSIYAKKYHTEQLNFSILNTIWQDGEDYSRLDMPEVDTINDTIQS